MSAAHQEPAEPDDLLGRTVGKYELTRLLGVGGMGRVYEGVHGTLKKKFALKFVDRESLTPEAVQRFQREAQAAGSVDSAHIVDIFDVGMSDEGRPYIVMELLRGEDLGHRIRRLGRLDLAEALRVVAQVLRGLARAHEAGIVHRDLKPDNIFLVERDDDPAFVKILDFGVSKIQRRDPSMKTITREGVVLGTPVYMSPEQAQAHPDLDARTDLWAVGAILYECLAGSPPFSGQTYEAVIVSICTRDAEDIRMRNPEVSPGIAAFLSKALMRDKEQRFGTAREMLDGLVNESDGLLPVSLNSDSLKRVIRPPSSSASALKGAKSLAAVSTIAATPAPGASGSSQSLPPRRAPLIAVGGALLVGGVVGGVLYANQANSGAGIGTNQQPQVIVVNQPGTTTTVIVSASAPTIAPSSAEPAASGELPSATASSSNSARGGTSATATASATAGRPIRVGPGKMGPVKTSEPTLTIKSQ